VTDLLFSGKKKNLKKTAEENTLAIVHEIYENKPSERDKGHL
jgi:hypothetical protein